jgi:hypothetical protein
MKYLDPAEQELLCDLMTKHEYVRRYPRYLECRTYNIELIKDAKPYHAKAFPVPEFINRPCGLRWNSAKSEFYK